LTGGNAARNAVVGMSTDRVHRSDFLPLLARGKRRRPGKGVYFMEFASYLAGERWSEHPACTPPARRAGSAGQRPHLRSGTAGVGRTRSNVIGVTGSDLRIDARIALRCARTELPSSPQSGNRSRPRRCWRASGCWPTWTDTRLHGEPVELRRTGSRSPRGRMGAALQQQYRHLPLGVPARDRADDRRVRRPRHRAILRARP
jgi:hypothetical protein